MSYYQINLTVKFNPQKPTGYGRTPESHAAGMILSLWGPCGGSSMIICNGYNL